MAMADWIKQAEEQAKKYSNSVKTSNQYLIDQLNKSRDTSLAQLDQQKANDLEKIQKQQDNALYNINAQKSNINRTANDNAQQLNVNRLLNLQDNQYAMNRAGLGTQGIVGSQVNAINNAYGKDLTNVLNQRTSDLNDLELQKQNTNLGYDTSRIDLANTYGTNRANLINQYDTNLANLQREIEDQALNQYNNTYNNYLSLMQQDYQNQQDEIARQEAIREWEAELGLKQAAQDESKRQWQEEFDYAKQQAKKAGGKSSGSGTYSYVGGFTDTPSNNTSTTSNTTNTTKNKTNILNPLHIINKAAELSSKDSGKKINNVAGMWGPYVVYSDGSKYYTKDGNNYVDITNEYKKALAAKK